MAIEIRAERVVTPTSIHANVSAVIATATASAIAPTVISTPVQTAKPFHVVQEYFHDGGAAATNETLDLQFDGASFKAVLTTAENNYIANHHLDFVYFCIPHDLVSTGVGDNGLTAEANLQNFYPQSTDANYRTVMQNLTAAYGGKMYIMCCPEWDNDPSNRGWATNRFTEVTGIGGASRGDLPTGLTHQQAYDQWKHFYLANNHGGIIDHHQLGQLLSVPFGTRGYKIQANNGFAGNAFFSYEMGIDRVTLQRNNDDTDGLIGAVGFIRGAAAQYGKEFGFDTSHSRSWGPNAGVTGYNSSQVLTSGWSAATYKRHYYISWMSGADVLMEEGADHTTNGNTNINGRLYTPFGVTLRDFCNCALVRHPQRGVPHVPVAIMKDHIAWVEPRYGQFNQGRGTWYGQISPNAGENMLHNLLDLCYPNYSVWGSSTTTAEPWGSGRWGEQFDVLTERASATVMANYPVVLLSMNTPMDATLQAKLDTFVRAGGILVINAKQLTGSAHSALTGVTVTGTASTSGTLTWELDGTTTSEPTFNYTTVTLGTATRIARTGASTPQVTRNLVGSGQVWTVLPDWMSNPGNTATLGVAQKLIDYLIAQFAVGTISGGNHSNIDYLVTKQAGAGGTTNLVTVVNTNSPGGATWTGTVSLPQGAPVREWISDTTPTSSNAGGRTNITASVPAGDVKVYAVG